MGVVEERVLVGTILYMYHVYKGERRGKSTSDIFFTAFRNFRYITPAVTRKCTNKEGRNKSQNQEISDAKRRDSGVYANRCQDRICG